MDRVEAVPLSEKYILTLKEASAYFGISYRKIRYFCKDHKDAEFIIWSGSRALIKRKLFERFVDETLRVI